jgi:hypothetical protein
VSSLMKPLAVQDVFSVFTDIDPTSSSPTTHILIELLTSDGLLILQIPEPMARELGASLSRISLEPDNPSEQTPTRPADLRR